MLVLPSAFYDRWKDNPTVHIHISPFFVVPKKGEQTATDGRAVGDQSFPRGSSMNELTVKELTHSSKGRVVKHRLVTDSTANTKTKKKTTVINTPKRPSDRGIVDLLPKHDGKSVYLRHLCWSKVEGKCVADDRCHYVPETQLPAAVVKHMSAKGWGGIFPKFPHMQP
jgi:hypothetical protein